MPGDSIELPGSTCTAGAAFKTAIFWWQIIVLLFILTPVATYGQILYSSVYLRLWFEYLLFLSAHWDSVIIYLDNYAIVCSPGLAALWLFDENWDM